jgi:hypothetical protein
MSYSGSGLFIVILSVYTMGLYINPIVMSSV